MVQTPLQARGPRGLPKEASSGAQENEGSDGARREGGGGVIRQVLHHFYFRIPSHPCPHSTP